MPDVLAEGVRASQSSPYATARYGIVGSRVSSSNRMPFWSLADKSGADTGHSTPTAGSSIYDVTFDPTALVTTCTCPATSFREHSCKHGVALAMLVSSGVAFKERERPPDFDG